MKTLISWTMALSILLAIPGMALAKDKKGGGPGGKVTAVNVSGNTITLSVGKKGEAREEKTYNVSDATITVDGASAKLVDVLVGMKVTITAGASPDTVTAIAASTKKGGGKKGDKGDDTTSEQ